MKDQVKKLSRDLSSMSEASQEWEQKYHETAAELAKLQKSKVKTYMQAIDHIGRRCLTVGEEAQVITTIAWIYGKTEESVRTSLTVKRLQLACIKELDHE